MNSSTSNCMVVFDLEWTAWEGSEKRQWSGPNENREIIQIGAVVMHFAASKWRKGDVFNMYVRPTIRPVLSDYISVLTGISQDTIDQHGQVFITALNDFKNFCPKNAILCSNGNDWDVLKENCIINGIEIPFSKECFFNIHPFIVEKLGIGYKFSSSDLTDILGFKGGKKHHALFDALAVAETLIRLNWKGF